MTDEHKKARRIGVVLCPVCKQIHLVVRDEDDRCFSISINRREWATLLGAYGDLLDQINREGTG